LKEILKQRLYKGSIKKRLRTIIVLVVFSTAILGYSGFVFWYMNNQQEKAINLSQSVALVLSQDFAKLLLLNQLAVASDITAKLKSFKTLNSMVLYNNEGIPVYQYHKEDRSFVPPKLKDGRKLQAVCENNNLHTYTTAQYEGMVLGEIGFNFVIDSLWTLLQRDVAFLVALAFFMLFISYVLAEIFAKRFTAPILKLVAFLENIELNTLFQHKIYTKQNDEFGKLYDEINIMLQRLDKAHEEQKVAAAAFETPSGMTITDANQKILRINRAFTEITGYTEDDIIGKTPNILSSGYHDNTFYKEMYLVLEKNNYWSGEIYNRHKNGKIYPQYLTIQVVLNEQGETQYYVSAFLDLTLQKNTEKKLDFLRTHDSLTSLANKEFFIQEIQQYLDSDETKKYGAIFCTDFRNFKLINDAHGHMIGDSVLQTVAKRLKNKLPKAALHARVSADEFAIWYKDIASDAHDAAILAKEIAEEIIALLSDPYEFLDHKIHSIPCVGIALYKPKDKNSIIITQQANSALHLAKLQEQSNTSFFDKSAEKLAKQHLSLYTQLLHALAQKHFELFYQAQYDENGTIFATEALVRWRDPQRGLISPLEFIPIAEKTSLIIPLGLWILQTATKQLALWQEMPKTAHLSIAVNISAKQFYQEDFVTIVKELIEQNNINAKRLKLELTETLFVEDIDTVTAKMHELRLLGVTLSLDDFGTGYSSLAYLKKLPLDQIKIDQSFVKNMLQNSSDVAIIKTILSLAEAFNLEVIAEGVETQEHYNALLNLKCKAFQGYYFSKPQTNEELLNSLN